MKIVNIFDAKSNLSRLLADAVSGEEVVIANRGTPVARIVPMVHASRSTGAALSEWLTRQLPPVRMARSTEEITEGIAEERESWE